MKTALIRALSVCLAFAATSANAGDWIDTRLTFAISDCNLLAAAGETTPNCPNPRIGGSNANTQFFDNINSRFSGFETLSHAVLYTKAPSFFEGLTTEAALSVLLLERPSGEISLRDDSSYIRLAYRAPGWSEKDSVSLTGFPVSADRFRLGYAYRVTWGGTPIFGTDALRNGVPGFKLQIDKHVSEDFSFYAFGGGKTALLFYEDIKEQDVGYGVLGGGGVTLMDRLRVETGVGYFQKGIVPSLATQGVRAPVNALGASGQVLVKSKGEPVGVSVDLRLYRNDPEAYEKLFRPERYPGGFSYTASVEGGYLVQTLADPDVFGRTVPQSAQTVVLQGRVKYNYLRVHALALYRTLSYIQFDVPSIPPYFDFPDGTEVRPEVWGAVGADYHFPALHLTVGAVGGVQQPASFTSPEPIVGGSTGETLGRRTVVVRDVNVFAVLPPDTTPLLIYSAKTTAKWDISEVVAGIAEVYWTRDPNRATFIQDVSGVTQQVFEREDAIGFNLLLQARF